MASHSILVATSGELAPPRGSWVACIEAGARVSVNIRVQDLDLFPGPRADNRRVEVVADGLVSTVRVDGAPRRVRAERDGAASDQARRTKERTNPELTGEHGRARLVVLACETGGRWSEESHSFLRQLAQAGRSPARCELQERRGSGGGTLPWRVAPLRRSRSPCWIAEEVWGLMASGKTVTGASSELSAHVF